LGNRGPLKKKVARLKEEGPFKELIGIEWRGLLIKVSVGEPNFGKNFGWHPPWNGGAF